ncbi:MAG TPA: polyketide cyclase, partial [Halomonas sp.]|nr:polyketide cyclase [Halomonas sp.]
MSVSLSTPIATYIAISNGADDAPLAECFTADARVLDEGQTHQGIAAIRAWLRDTRRQFEYHVAPTDVSRDGDKMVITTTVTGNFPGSPVQL